MDFPHQDLTLFYHHHLRGNNPNVAQPYYRVYVFRDLNQDEDSLQYLDYDNFLLDRQVWIQVSPSIQNHQGD